MTIISILIAFTLCHFVRELRHLRRLEWVSAFTKFCNDKFQVLPGWSGTTGAHRSPSTLRSQYTSMGSPSAV